MVDQGEIRGLYYLDRQPVQLRWAEGRITAFEPAKERPSEKQWLAPALFDVQVNGYAGVDFQTDNLTLAQLLTAARQLQADGCARFCLTLTTALWPKLIARLKFLRELRAQAPELESAIAGWHLEGPFLSPEPGFHGAHDPALMCDPTPEHIEELRRAAGADPVLLTLAPERPGALDAIRRAAALGMTVSLGHTNAPQEVLAAAVQAGATGFTHLANGIPADLNRHDNILWRVFNTPGLRVGLIADGIHVSPALFQIMHRLLGPENIYYTTDAMSAAGAPPGRYTIGPIQVEVGPDQIVREPGKTNFAGSALRPITGVFRAARMLACPWQEAWTRFSQNPQRLLGLKTGPLAVGQEANFCVITADGQTRKVQVFIRGKLRAEHTF